jgi:hypothetical protein
MSSSKDVTTSDNMALNRIDDEYETKMAGFEVDCNDGKGEPEACHHVGEFYSVVKEERERAANVYEKNCREKNFGPSCFNLGRLFCKCNGSIIDLTLLIAVVLVRWRCALVNLTISISGRKGC